MTLTLLLAFAVLLVIGAPIAVALGLSKVTEPPPLTVSLPWGEPSQMTFSDLPMCGRPLALAAAPPTNAQSVKYS